MEIWSSGNVEEFLSFEPTELPKWRQNMDAPPISEMLADIVRYKHQYDQLIQSNEIDSTKIFDEFIVSFLYSIQNEEGIGVKHENLTQVLMTHCDDKVSYSPLEKSKIETVNLYKAYKHIKHEISMNETVDFTGLIEVESLIKYTHNSFAPRDFLARLIHK